MSADGLIFIGARPSAGIWWWLPYIEAFLCWLVCHYHVSVIKGKHGWIVKRPVAKRLAWNFSDTSMKNFLSQIFYVAMIKPSCDLKPNTLKLHYWCGVSYNCAEQHSPVLQIAVEKYFVFVWKFDGNNVRLFCFLRSFFFFQSVYNSKWLPVLRFCSDNFCNTQCFGVSSGMLKWTASEMSEWYNV